MKLVWKYGRLSSISFLKSSIPFWHRPYSIPKFPFHSITCPGCRFYIIIIIVTFYPDGCSQVENPEAPDLKKLLPLSAPFQHFRFRVCFRFQPLSSKCFRFHKKVTASTASSFRFHILDLCPPLSTCNIYGAKFQLCTICTKLFKVSPIYLHCTIGVV